MQRICSVLQIKKERIGDYLAAHQVWPEQLQAMHDVGIRNYSLFMAKDGMVVEYLETENPEVALQKLSQTDVGRRWEEHMAEYFETGSDSQAGDVQRLSEYFHTA